MSAMQNLSLHLGLWQAASGMLERSWRKGLDVMVAAWSLDSGEILYVFGGHSGWVNSVAWSPDGTRIASGDGERVIVVHAFAGNDERRAGVEV